MTRCTVLACVALVALRVGARAQQVESDDAGRHFEAIVSALSEGVRQPDGSARGDAPIFTAEADLRVGGDVLAVGPKAIWGALRDNRIWSEMTPRLFTLESVRTVTGTVALLDAVAIRYGSTIWKSSQPVLLILKRTGADWRIASVRFAPSCGAPGALQPQGRRASHRFSACSAA